MRIDRSLDGTLFDYSNSTKLGKEPSPQPPEPEPQPEPDKEHPERQAPPEYIPEHVEPDEPWPRK